MWRTLSVVVSMPAQLASLLTLAFIAYLFRRDFGAQPKVTPALWIPFIWILLMSTRGFSVWFTMLGLPLVGIFSPEEGSPVDALVWYTLIVCGLWVIKHRRINLAGFIQNNRCISFFLLFCLVAIV